jgi:hypothetical protein
VVPCENLTGVKPSRRGAWKYRHNDTAQHVCTVCGALASAVPVFCGCRCCDFNAESRHYHSKLKSCYEVAIDYGWSCRFPLPSEVPKVVRNFKFLEPTLMSGILGSLTRCSFLLETSSVTWSSTIRRIR